jgi:hypothetical protein
MALNPRAHPRLSASQLADYLVAPTPTSQMGILRQAKYPGPSRPLVIQYQHACRGISACLQTPESVNRLVAAAVTNLEQRRDDTASGPLVRDDAQRSIEVIETFQRTVNALNLADAIYRAAPAQAQSLTIQGVEVMVFPDAIAEVQRGNELLVGEVFIRCTIGGAGEAAENRRAEANGYLVTIAHMHALQFHGHRGTPTSTVSRVIDVPRETVVRGTANPGRRIRNIEDGCRMIAAFWHLA